MYFDSYPNRREFPRTECLVPVHYKVNWRSYSGFILDLSETGVFIETDREFDTNGKISLRYVDPNGKKPSLINGIIAWSRDNGIGVKFKHIFSFPNNN